MTEDHLLACERAKERAQLYVSIKDFAAACESYLEAAGHMLTFADTLQGEQRITAQQLTEQLINKAREAKACAASAVSPQPARPMSPPPILPPPILPPPVPPSPAPHTDARTAIARDQESVRRTADPADDAPRFTPVKAPNVRFADIAGLEDVKQAIQLKVIQPLLHPELYRRFAKETNGGVLLYGPPGTGKTMIARAIAAETDLDFFAVRCSDIVGRTFQEGAQNLAALFDAARLSGRAMIFFDEFDALAPRRSSSSSMMRRLVTELLTQMDGFEKNEGTLIILASTNLPWNLDSAVLRPPRMSERIYVGLPDYDARLYMVRHALEPMPVQEALDYEHIARALEGFNGSDITAFVEKVKEMAIRRALRDGNMEQFITAQDVEDALAQCRSSVQQADLDAFAKWEASQA